MKTPDTLYNRDSSIFGNDDTRCALPKRRLPEHSMRPDDACALIKEELLLDGNARQNLATFCQTWDEAQVRQLMDICIDKNLIDKDEYPQTAAIEQRCVRMISSLWNAPDADNTIGCATVGSSEACMLAGMAALHRWRAKRKSEGKAYDKPNLVCGPVQICWHKFCRYWDVEIREMPMEDGRYGLCPEVLADMVDENTIIVMSTFGVTHTGLYENVAAIAAYLDEMAASGGADVDMHVDAASGGFLAPFLATELYFDFRLSRVKSISASGHKYGLAPLGCGWVIWREKGDLPKELVFDVNYLGGSVPTIALNFSRPAGQVVAQYYDFVRLGMEGYKRVHQASYEVASWLAVELSHLGDFEFISVGDSYKGLPTVCFYLKEGADQKYSLYELSERLRLRGWQVPAYTLPAHMTQCVVMRIMVRQGFSRDMAELFLADIERAIDFLQSRNVIPPQSEGGGNLFHHA